MLKKPLTKKSVLDAFATLELSPADIQVDAGGAEVQVEGAWSRTRLAKTFTALGFKKADEDGYAFVNEARTVGMVLMGVGIDHAANRFRTFNFEVQARSQREAQRRDQEVNPRLF